jgi:transcriptional regulator with XRE-family HTH domain
MPVNAIGALLYEMGANEVSKLKIDCERLKKKRVGQMLSQIQLSEMAGVAQNTVYNMEHGRDSGAVTLYKIAKVFGLTVDELIIEEEP